MENQPAKSHVSSGLRKILEHSFLYNIWQLIIGGEAVHRSFINDYCKPHKHASILEIGCGTGTILEHIDEDLNVQYYGFDENPTYIDFAKTKYGDRGRFYCARVSDANIPSGGFDIVLALGILHHLNEPDSLKLIESAWDNLKPGGFLFSADPVWTNSQSRLEKYLISKDRGQNVRTEAGYRRLIGTRFDKVESHVVSGLLNIPWTANLIKATKTTSSSA
jgi:2-polyprenyl-3-methyl-5-hydroxy-6-metoxy-1,4-benzoquinol methylase